MIEFKNVYKTYPNGFTALKNINLQIEQGEFELWANALSSLSHT